MVSKVGTTAEAAAGSPRPPSDPPACSVATIGSPRRGLTGRSDASTPPVHFSEKSCPVRKICASPGNGRVALVANPRPLATGSRARSKTRNGPSFLAFEAELVARRYEATHNLSAPATLGVFLFDALPSTYGNSSPPPPTAAVTEVSDGKVALELLEANASMGACPMDVVLTDVTTAGVSRLPISLPLPCAPSVRRPLVFVGLHPQLARYCFPPLTACSCAPGLDLLYRFPMRQVIRAS